VIIVLSIVANKPLVKGATGEAKGAEAPSPLIARSKLRKKIRSFNFKPICAYNPIKMFLQHYHTLPVI